MRSPQCDVDTLMRVGAMLRSAPRGRKMVIFISGGRSLTGPPTEEDRIGLTNRSRDLDAIREMFRRLQESNVVIYGFDPTGLETYGFTAGMTKPVLVKLPVNESLRSFAESTGGRAVTDMNRPWEHVRAVFAENSAYYLLGFQSTNATTDGRFRRIRVSVKRRDVDVRTRSGYFANAN